MRQANGLLGNRNFVDKPCFRWRKNGSTNIYLFSKKLNVKAVKVVKQLRINCVKDEMLPIVILYFSILLCLNWKSSWLESKLSKKVEVKKIPTIE